MFKAKLDKVQRMKTQVKLVFSVPLEEAENDFELLEGFKGFVHFQGKPITMEIEKAMQDRHYGHNTDGKSKSQILRGELLTLSHYENSEADKEQFYNEHMDKLIKYVKDKIQKLINGN